MIQHILFVACPSQIAITKTALDRLGAEVVDGQKDREYRLSHRLLGDMTLYIHLVDDLDGVTPHLKQNPIDLLIYDERGEGAIEVTQAVNKIQKDVVDFANLWGPDFLFPSSRVVAILAGRGDDAKRSFELGRGHIREVCVSPKNLGVVLKWLRKILTRGVIRTGKVGMALSGGGLDGFLYQIGCLHALDCAFGKRSIYDCQAYSGVSSGSLVTSLLVNDVPLSELIKALNMKSDILPQLTSRKIFSLAAKDISRRIMSELSKNFFEVDPSKWFKKFLRSIPTGFFKGETLEDYLRYTIEQYGGKNEFKDLDRSLFIGATDQDSFEHIVFGEKPWDKVSISEAVRASCAFPPIFTPVQLNSRYFIDGQVTRTCNVELLVKNGCRLIFIIDPVQPFASQIPGSVDNQGGIFALIQVVKSLVYSRFQATLTHITERYPDVDFIVLQPDEISAEIMAGSPMRYKLRLPILELAFKGTLRRLRERHHVYSAILGKYGFALKSQRELLEIEREGHEISESAS